MDNARSYNITYKSMDYNVQASSHAILSRDADPVTVMCDINMAKEATKQPFFLDDIKHTFHEDVESCRKLW